MAHLPPVLKPQEAALLAGEVEKPSWESRNEGIHERVSFEDTIWGFDLAGGAYYKTPLRVTFLQSALHFFLPLPSPCRALSHHAFLFFHPSIFIAHSNIASSLTTSTADKRKCN
ncbi:hypothetical protein EVAR_87364_1 [Eumeta japonica]|uniref:Uncharacterized protein n=1 Tax=Eumeta variegata TaxID=151549 RepID=A0A4C1Y3V7_EUMVA|nr:hypothetical protein EVAR_87364_1 [Eumeta japonica]